MTLFVSCPLTICSHVPTTCYLFSGARGSKYSFAFGCAWARVPRLIMHELCVVANRRIHTFTRRDYLSIQTYRDYTGTTPGLPAQGTERVIFKIRETVGWNQAVDADEDISDWFTVMFEKDHKLDELKVDVPSELENGVKCAFIAVAEDAETFSDTLVRICVFPTRHPTLPCCATEGGATR